ncbi:MAG: CHASE2 domain-containing protein [Usitatibacter sp.]
MSETDGAARAATSALWVAAIALAGLALSLTPATARLDDALLDREWLVLRELGARAAPEDIVIVGIDPSTVSAIPAPPGLWHEALGLALMRIASARPRAIGLDYPLPERSFDAIHPGLDRALLVGLVAAARNGPFVAALSIDPKTRSARPIHAPFVAALGESRLGIDLVARDADGVTRRFSTVIPTEDGGFPTFAGRLCRALSGPCGDGLIHYALGAPYRMVSLKAVLEAKDSEMAARLFRDRIVLIGETQPYSDRIDVPVNLAAWEEPHAPTSPGIVVHAQSLRTALLDAAPREASRPLAVLLLSAAALLFLVRDWRLAAAACALAAVVTFAGAVFALRGGLYVPVAAPLATLLLAFALRAFGALRRQGGTRAAPNIRHSA